MTMLRLTSCLAILLACLTVQAADKLVFKNGDVLSGTLVSQKDGTITFDSAILGVIKISEEEAEVQTPAEVQEEVDGPPEPGTGQDLAAAAGGPAAPETDGDTTAAAEEQADEFDAMIAEWRETFESVIPDGWTGKIDVGFTYTNSNSRKTAFVTGFKAKKESPPHHYSLNGFYEFGDTVAQDGTKSIDTDKYGGGFNYKYDFAEDWFFFSDTTYLKDQVKDIKDQATETVGVGYRIFNEEDLKLNVNLGGAIQYNNVAGQSEKWFGYVVAGNDFQYIFNKYIRVEQNAYIRMDPADTNNYQYKFYLAGIAKLTDWIEASLSYNIDYDNIVGPGSKKLEEQIIFALGIPF